MSDSVQFTVNVHAAPVQFLPNADGTKNYAIDAVQGSPFQLNIEFKGGVAPFSVSLTNCAGLVLSGDRSRRFWMGRRNRNGSRGSARRRGYVHGDHLGREGYEFERGGIGSVMP